VAYTTPLQRSFNGGVWSARLFGRSDLTAYQTALSKCENMFPSVSGHIRKRTGSLHVGTCPAGTITSPVSQTIRLIPFVFSSSDASVLEIGYDSTASATQKGYIRIWKNGVLQEWQPDKNFPATGVLSGMISHPFTVQEIKELDWAQDADTFIFTHKNHSPKRLIRLMTQAQSTRGMEMWGTDPLYGTETPGAVDTFGNPVYRQDPGLLGGGVLAFSYGPYLPRGMIQNNQVPTWPVVGGPIAPNQTPYLCATLATTTSGTPAAGKNNRPDIPSMREPQTSGSPFKCLLTLRTGSEVGGATDDFNDELFTDTKVEDTFNADRDVGRMIVLNCFHAGTVAGEPMKLDGMSDLFDAEFAYPLYGRITAVSTDQASIEVEFYDGIWYRTIDGHGGTDKDGRPLPNNYISICTQVWHLGAYYEDAVAGTKEYPSTCTFFEERLIFGATDLSPDLIHASRNGSIGDFDILSASDISPFQPGTKLSSLDGATASYTTQGPNPQAEVLATSGMSLGISSQEIAQIQWIRGLVSSLVIGTTRGIFQMQANNSESIFGPTESIQSRPTNALGGSRKGLTTVRDRLLFPLPSGERLFEIGYDLSADGFTAQEISVFNSDILDGGVSDATLQQDPEPIYWIITQEKNLIGLTVDQAQKVYAFHTHLLGGENATVESVASVPAADSGNDELYMVVTRTINETVVKAIEYIPAPWEIGDSTEAQFFVDSGTLTTHSPSPSNTATAAHLPLTSVDIVADGEYITNNGTRYITNGSGVVTLPDNYTTIYMGLPYTSEFLSMPVVIPDPQGTSFGKMQLASGFNAYIIRTSAYEVAAGHPDSLQWQNIPLRTPEDPLGSPITPVTDIQHGRLTTNSSRSYVMGARSQIPLNFEMAAISLYMESSSR